MWEDNYFSTDDDNPLRHLLAEEDTVTLLQILLSLITLAFAYDAITGEREVGTLSLMLANPVVKHRDREVSPTAVKALRFKA